MSDKVIVTVIGVVQKFGAANPVIKERTVNDGQTVLRSFTIQTATQGYVGINVWPEHAQDIALVQEGALMGIRGEFTESTGNNGQTYKNIKAYTMSAAPVLAREPRGVVNQQPAAAQAAPTNVTVSPAPNEYSF